MSTLEKLAYAVSDPKTDPGMPKSGDAVVVCRQDDSTSFFLLDVDHKALLGKVSRGEAMTLQETGQLLAAQKAMTLFFASQNDKIMDTLIEIMNAPEFLGDAHIPPLN